MQVQINVGQETSSHELRSLAIFFNHLAAAGEVVSVGQPPVIEKVQVQVVQPETVTPTNEAPPPEAGSEKTRRARRTKAEMEAFRASQAAAPVDAVKPKRHRRTKAEMEAFQASGQ